VEHDFWTHAKNYNYRRKMIEWNKILAPAKPFLTIGGTKVPDLFLKPLQKK
jgi:hypothetical protein